ncbi:MAG: hypothetical protein JWO38_2337 [Gemmataceae bacterium]|nr:hypothetical protein [Gemmataceae bacterium]
MASSQLDAKAYGIGQLITQRKMFVVPEHQRAFAWTVDQIEQYLDDIASSHERNATDYFIGTVVLQGLPETAWQILDGQQRLATTIMAYSAIREWLKARGFETDSRQIESEFIGVRQLGGTYNSRLRLNSENHDYFQRCVVQSMPETELQKELASAPKMSSNYRLVEGAIRCRKWIDEYTKIYQTIPEQAAQLFRLSSFIETRVIIVCLDVSSQIDAYVLFETLNTRGMDLSALDLVKNYIFSQLPNSSDVSSQQKWANIVNNIEDKDADDFLKVFWTSRYGIVSKAMLFEKLRGEYKREVGAARLLDELVDASEKFSALDDPEHELWKPFGWQCRQRIGDLKLLGNRQLRPLILGGISNFSSNEFTELVWLLIVVVIRYQIAGRGRTGFVEKEFARLAQSVYNGSVRTAADAHRHLLTMLPDDVSFHISFSKLAESKAAKVQYLLLELEATFRSLARNFTREDYLTLRTLSSSVSPDYIFPHRTGLEGIDQYTTQIGNRILIEDDLIRLPPGKTFQSMPNTVLKRSSMELTRIISERGNWNINEIQTRGSELASLAVRTWIFPQSNSYR